MLAITTAQKEHVEAENSDMVLKEWLGNGHSVPVKDCVATALKYYYEAKREQPDFVLAFSIPLDVYHNWIDNDTMIRVPYVSGYRIESDLNMNDLDAEWKVHPVLK